MGISKLIAMCLNTLFCPFEHVYKIYLQILTKWANPGAFILHLYGLFEPSDTKYTPNSPYKHVQIIRYGCTVN